MLYRITKIYKYDKVNLIIVLIIFYVNFHNHINSVHIFFDILFDNREIGYFKDYSRVITAECY